MPDFLAVAGVVLLIPRGQCEQLPDGAGGKRRWAFTTAPVTRADEATVRAAAGVPSAAESDRAIDGTLHSDRPRVTATGEAFGAAEGQSGTVEGELTITSAPYRHTVVGGVAVTRRALVGVLREA